jgi:iron complex outermembrane receptor protein
MKKRALTAAVAAMLSVSVNQPAQAQSSDEVENLGKIVSVGTRVSGRTITETAAPVDIITSEEITNSGATEVGKILQLLAPSFNFSSTTISDGTDIIRPATLRGLGPDQVLVLVNGKRRHQQALVNVQQTIARGSAGTDINAIPVTAIDRIEILRDGAAAQYGSDAIAGVINIILKEQTDHTSITLQAGQHYEGDGEVLMGGVNTGFSLGDDGFVNLSLEYRDRGETNRAGVDSLRVDPPRVTQRIGDADSENVYFWFNGEVPIGSAELYFFGGGSDREGNSSGFFRSAGDDRTSPDLYPNGFLPTLITNVNDRSLNVGLRNDFNDRWSWDLNAGLGHNRFTFRTANSWNVSFGPGSPTGAQDGTLKYDQRTINFDVRGTYDSSWDAPVYASYGFEYRDENYEIVRGDLVSYAYGPNNDPSIVILNQNGGIAAAGIQGFPGFTPATEVDDGRDSIGVYADFESNLTDDFMMGLALRAEDYSDFGNSFTGKLSGLLTVSDRFSIRGTVSTGFRAPSVQQAFYSQVSTNLNNDGVLTETITARQGSEVAQAFGIPDLEEETSVNASLGLVFEVNDRFTLTADLYRIDIDDRIVFSTSINPEADSENCTDASVCPIAVLLRPLNVGQAQFFTNAIDTETTGLDIVGTFNTEFDNGSLLNVVGALHFNDTDVTTVRSSSSVLQPGQIFDETQRVLIEEGQPGEHALLSFTHDYNQWTTNLRFNYFGSVAGQGFTGIRQEWDGKWLTDLSVSYAFNEQVRLTVGGTNIFDEYPDKWDEVDGFPFPQLGFVYGWETLPFGINGGFYFAKLNVDF